MRRNGSGHGQAADFVAPAGVPYGFVERIIEVLHPTQIWLFGSRARGTASAASDWDFMVVLPDEAPDTDLDLRGVWKRLRDLRVQGVEVFPVRKSEFEAARQQLGTLSQIVASEGRAIYG